MQHIRTHRLLIQVCQYCIWKSYKVQRRIMSKEQIEQFNRDGFLVVEDLFTEEECDCMMKATFNLIDQLDLSTHPMTVFSTTDQTSDDYFMTSGDKIRYFFEEEARDEKGYLNRDKKLAVNKIGHALHVLDPVFKKMTFDERIQKLAKALGLEEPKIVQSMCIMKQPSIGGQVVPHQDGTFLHTTPLKLFGYWIALENADEENGCLHFIPGSHSKAITRRMIRNPDGGPPSVIFTAPPDEFDDSKFVPAPVKKGSCVLIHGQVVHKSEKNKSSRTRLCYTFHLVESKDVEYSNENWLQETSAVPFPLLYG